ncbi:aminoacyl-tRNA hydrolase [Chondromyces crocatus]|uniref:Peptidyl-tRNA hydrolase n=1 Tax=Chondromyces crocatus TaxID=52 RepID=A0A0K1EQ71_CHOCO|nr:aminoacyl-tRNA hydrolase [Chondromyces crocatus]AKT42802.1 peptidyl-tRNA hydrolase [Chondromyces crocatus]
MLLVVGLGNPGKEYASHRHNVGFMAVDALADEVRAEAFREKFSGHYAKASAPGEPLVLLKPMTYMNESGRCVQPAMAFFKIEPSRLIVIHDELDLPFGSVRLKFGGGHAGHNGLRSIMSCVGSGDFGRIRVGVGRPPSTFRGQVADYVLSGFDALEREALADCLKQTAQSVLEVATRGFNAAMNARNTRQKPGKQSPKGEAAEATDAASKSRPGSD